MLGGKDLLPLMGWFLSRQSRAFEKMRSRMSFSELGTEITCCNGKKLHMFCIEFTLGSTLDDILL